MSLIFVSGLITGTWRAFRLVTISIPETAATTIGFLGGEKRLIVCELGHSVCKAVSVEAIIVLGKSDSNVREMEVIFGEIKKDE